MLPIIRPNIANKLDCAFKLNRVVSSLRDLYFPVMQQGGYLLPEFIWAMGGIGCKHYSGFSENFSPMQMG